MLVPPIDRQIVKEEVMGRPPPAPPVVSAPMMLLLMVLLAFAGGINGERLSEARKAKVKLLKVKGICV